MEKKEMRLPLSGGCQCGQVRYEIRAAPSTVYLCHCSECQRQSGSAFAMSMFVPRDALAITAGTPREWRRRAPSGNMSSCFFCGECGARLFHNPDRNPALTILKPGTLDDTRWLAPVGHIWTRSAQPWVKLEGTGLCCEAQPTDMTPFLAAWQAAQGAAG